MQNTETIIKKFMEGQNILTRHENKMKSTVPHTPPTMIIFNQALKSFINLVEIFRKMAAVALPTSMVSLFSHFKITNYRQNHNHLNSFITSLSS